MKNITKENIDVLFEKYPPNKWIEIVYRYFSKETDKKDIVVTERLTYLLVVFFIVGFLLTAFNASRILIMIVTLGYTFLLSALIIFIFIGVFMNRKRLKKIMKELNVNIQEYNSLIQKYY